MISVLNHLTFYYFKIRRILFMHLVKKHPIYQRKMGSQKQRKIKGKIFGNHLSANKQILMIHTRTQQKRPVLTIEASLSQITHRGTQKIQSLPKLSSSTYKFNTPQKQKMMINISSGPAVTSNCWCLYDSIRKKYHGFRQEYRRQIASLTKIMTTYLAILCIQQLQLSLNFIVKITKEAAETGGTTADLQANLWVSLNDLLYGAMLPSGNDAAYCLAEYIGYFMWLYNKDYKKMEQVGSKSYLDLTKINTIIYVQEFIRLMNEKAAQLNLLNTRFSNPHGLQNALNTSSAKDIILLSYQSTKNRLFSKIMNTFYYKYELFQGERFKSIGLKRWFNTNKLLQKGWEGVKTGHTSSAGSCLCSLKEGIFITVLNSNNAETRFTDTQKIFQWYKETFQSIKTQNRDIGIQSFCQAYSKAYSRKLPTMLTQISL